MSTRSGVSASTSEIRPPVYASTRQKLSALCGNACAARRNARRSCAVRYLRLPWRSRRKDMLETSVNSERSVLTLEQKDEQIAPFCSLLTIHDMHNYSVSFRIHGIRLGRGRRWACSSADNWYCL